jgi:hypothetical protein
VRRARKTGCVVSYDPNYRRSSGQIRKPRNAKCSPPSRSRISSRCPTRNCRSLQVPMIPSVRGNPGFPRRRARHRVAGPRGAMSVRRPFAGLSRRIPLKPSTLPGGRRFPRRAAVSAPG